MAKLIAIVLAGRRAARRRRPRRRRRRATTTGRSAQVLGSLPATVRGTTVDATLEETEPFSCQGQTAGSVWYELPAGAQRDLVLELDAAGDLDAVVDVYRRERSQVTSVICAQTNRRGSATLDFRQRRNATYLIRVAPLFNSVTDAFTLRVVQPDLPERPPGRALGPSGASGSVDAIANPDDAYAVSMAAGRSYRVHIVSRQRCVNAGCTRRARRRSRTARRSGGSAATATSSTRRAPARAGATGCRCSRRSNRRGGLPYHVQVLPAGPDDTAPGLELANDRRVRGSLRGSGADVVDLYRFEVRRPSTLDLRMRTAPRSAFNLQLLDRARRADRVRVRRLRLAGDPAEGQAGPLLRRGALAHRLQRQLPAVAAHAHDHQDARDDQRRARRAGLRPAPR